MKWIFAILVALNLIVFGVVVAQRMLLTAPQATAPERTIILSGQATPAQNTVIASNVTKEAPPTQTPATEKEEHNNTQATEHAVAKPKKEKAKVNKPTPAPVKKAEKPTPPPPAKTKGKCGGASVVLPENVYHRIKGMLNEWPNAASREVGKNNHKTSNKSNEYVVLLNPSPRQNEDMMKLIAKGFKPRQENGLIILGKYATRAVADGLRKQVLQHGVQAKVMEKSIPGQAALSQANFRVIFMNINDADARKLNGILKPYAPLHRNPCK